MNNSLEICILEDKKIEPKCSTLDFTRETWKDDVTFVVEDKRLYASKSVLALFSPVFEAMFGTDFTEKTSQEVPLPGKKAQDFLQFLKCLYPVSTEPVTKENVFQILPLADEYQVKPLMEKCREVLLKNVSDRENGYNRSETLKCYFLAKRFDIPKIDNMCIQNIIKEYNLADISSEVADTMDKNELSEFWMDISNEQEKHLNEVTTNLVKLTLNTSNSNITVFENGMGAIIEHTVPNVFDPDLQYGESSKPVRLWNAVFTAEISVFNKEAKGHSEKYLSVFLSCQLPENWSCETRAAFALENVFAEKNKITKRVFSVKYKSTNTISWGSDEFERLSKFLTDTPEYVENFTGKLIVYILAKQPVEDTPEASVD